MLRIAVVLLGVTCVLMFLGVVDANGTPIKPDVRTVFRQHDQGQDVQFGPARAGWNGPEVVPAGQSDPNPFLETVGPAATARAVRASLFSALVPDPRAIAAIVLVILLLRRMRRSSRSASPAAGQTKEQAQKDAELIRAA